jgi:hypothetical protein
MRRGKVQLIDASTLWSPMRKSLGDKRRQIPPEKATAILKPAPRLQGRPARQDLPDYPLWLQENRV